MPENHLNALITLSDKIDVPIFVVSVSADEELRFRKLNHYHERVTGMSSAAIAGKRPDECLPPRLAANLSAKFLRCVRSQERLTYEEVLHLPKGEIWWQTTLTPVFLDGHGVIGLLGTAIDISDRKLRDIKLAREMADLRAENEELNTYTSMVAHDVRGPLRKMKMIADLVSNEAELNSAGEQVLTDLHQELLGTITDIADKALGHVDSILSYSRAIALKETSALEAVDLELLFGDIASLVDQQRAFQLDYPHEVVMAERVVLQIVVRNLVENAVKHGKSRCLVSVDSDAGSGDGAANQLVFRISDDGPGFEDSAEVFDAERARFRARPTSGFGLAAAQRIVEARGGAIWMEPGVLGGATVAFAISGQFAPAVVEPV
ncbi:MAG: PAS domain-containing sensor histidine kinase [Pseudomonadota bacterium]